MARRAMDTARPRARASALLLAATIALANGCVVEEGAPVRSARAPSSAVASRAGGVLPTGPIASPASARTLTSRVLATLVPLGSVPYDGQVLPIASPDGQFLAVQEGEPPTWEQLLALPGAGEATRTRLSIVRVGWPGQSGAPLSRVPADIPPGLLLGRSANDRGFLVESPRPDGSRWIGRVTWATGALEWLAQGPGVQAHAVDLPDGGLLFTRRESPTGVGVDELVLRDAGGVESARRDPAGAVLFPLACDEPGLVACLVASGPALDLEIVRVAGSPGSGRLGAGLARRTIARLDGDDWGSMARLAYQCVAGAPGALPVRASQAARRWGEFVVFQPSARRMVRLDPMSGQWRALPPDSFAATPVVGLEVEGYLCATPREVLFSPAPSRSDTGSGSAMGDVRQDARVLASPGVVRRVFSPGPPDGSGGVGESFLLLAPAPRDPGSIAVSRLMLGATEDPLARGASDQ